MNLGKFVFAQVMEHLPLHVFHAASALFRRAQGQVVLCCSTSAWPSHS